MGLAMGFAFLHFALLSKYFETIIDHFKPKREIKKDFTHSILHQFFQHKEDEFTKVISKLISEECDERIKLLNSYCLHCLEKYDDAIKLLSQVQLQEYEDDISILKKNMSKHI